MFENLLYPIKKFKGKLLLINFKENWLIILNWLGFKVDIFASEKVLSEAGIILDDDDPNKENIIDKSKSKSFKDMIIKELI